MKMAFSSKMNRVAILASALFGVSVRRVAAQDNFAATISYPSPTEYEITMTWDHNPDKIFIANGVSNPGDNSGNVQSGSQGKCNPENTASDSIGPDGIPYVLPRFFPKPVSSEITDATGIKFVSLDWQPCGHKDILICHAESHYDFHMYYVDETDLQPMVCNDNTFSKPTCPDKYDKAGEEGSNEKFFKLMKNNMIKSSTLNGKKTNYDFCVDPTSAMPKSGIHFGDVSETLEEWKEPVTILGSYDCKLTFFEAMFSYRWLRGFTKHHPSVGDAAVQWPLFESGQIEYENQDYAALPTSWSVQAGSNVADLSSGNECGYSGASNFDGSGCQITVKVRGTKCAAGGCGALPDSCGQHKACKSGDVIGLMPATTPVDSKTAATTTTSNANAGGSGNTGAGTTASTGAQPTGALAYSAESTENFGNYNPNSKPDWDKSDAEHWEKKGDGEFGEMGTVEKEDGKKGSGTSGATRNLAAAVLGLSVTTLLSLAQWL